MKTSLCRNLLLIILLAPLGIGASETPSQTPTIDFSSQSMRELVEYKRNNNFEALTPRSKQSYTNRFRDLSNQALNDLRTQLGITPEMRAQAQQPARIFIVIPAAANQGDPMHPSWHGAHNPDCICDILGQFMQMSEAEDSAEMDTSDEEPENQNPVTPDQDEAAQLANSLRNFGFKRQQ